VLTTVTTDIDVF